MIQNNMALIKLQIGKKGLTKEFIKNIKRIFESKTNESARINVLKSATRNRIELEEINQKILDSLGKNYTSKVIGYTIVLRKWRKARG